MDTFSKEEIEVFGKIIRSGILRYDIDMLMDSLKKIQQECVILDSDDEVTRVFKSFVIYGRVVDVASLLGIKPEIVSDILFYEKCEDNFLTLLGKYLYSISGTKFGAFLKIQVEVLFQTGTIDVKQEYLKWRLEIYKEELEKGTMTKQEIIEEVDRIYNRKR